MTLSSLLMGHASMSLAENAAALAGRCQGPAAHAKPLFDRGFKFAPALFGSGRWYRASAFVCLHDIVDGTALDLVS